MTVDEAVSRANVQIKDALVDAKTQVAPQNVVPMPLTPMFK